MASDFVVIENATWCPDINSVMEGFRHDGNFCNVTLRGCDDQEFQAHDLVLAASSADMQTLLLTQMQKDCVLQIETVQGKTIEYMLQFIYSGHVCLPVGELHALTALAEQLGIEQLKSLCSKIKRELESQEVTDLVDGATEDLVPYSYSESDDMSAAFCGDIMGTEGEGGVTEQVVELAKEADVLAEDQCLAMSAETVEISQGNLVLTTVKMDREMLQQHQQQQISLIETTSSLEPAADQALTQTADRMLAHPIDGKMAQADDGKLMHTNLREIMQSGDIVLTQIGDMVLTQTGESELTQTGDSAPTQIGDGEQAQTGVQVKVECLQHDQDAEQTVYVTLKSDNREELPTETGVKLEAATAPSMSVYTSKSDAPTATHGAADVFSCSECGKTFKKRCYLDDHMRVHTGVLYECLVCGKRFQWQRGLQLHSRIHTGEKPYACKTCGQRFAHSSNYLAHTRRHLDATPFVCAVCGQKFGSKSSMIRHRRGHNEHRLVFECDHCQKQFSERHLLVKHQRIHTGECPYTCDVCQRSFMHSSSLAYHKWTHRTDRPIACDVCGTGCISKAHLAAHMRTHTGEKPFVCRVCKKGFAVQANLISHMRIHTGERPYKCLLCGKSFVTSSNLHRHQEWHTKQVEQETYTADERPFQCSVCGKRFAKRSCMRQHEKYHMEGDTRFQCPDCDANFSRPFNLKRHLKQHLHGDIDQNPNNIESTKASKQSKFECATCSKVFTRILHLKRHEAMHRRKEFMYSAEGRPFECDTCKKRFKSKGTLGQHMVTHKADTERKHVFCTFCSKGFIRRNHLANHISKVHANETIKPEQTAE